MMYLLYEINKKPTYHHGKIVEMALKEYDEPQASALMIVAFTIFSLKFCF